MLKVGDSAPDFCLPDQNGRQVRLSDVLKKSHAIIYFYPKDNTTGCTAQSCSFRDNFDEVQDKNTQIIGISTDDIASHRAFAEQYGLPFILLSDGNGSVRKSFGVRKTLGLLPGRATFVVDRHGIIRFAFSSQIHIQRHVDEAIRALAAIEQDQG